MELHTWLIYLLAVTGLSLTPGPNSLLALTHGALYGHRRSLFTIAGGSAGFVLLIALSMLGIGALLQASAGALVVLKFAAAPIWCGSACSCGGRPQSISATPTPRRPEKSCPFPARPAGGDLESQGAAFLWRLPAPVHRCAAQPVAAVRGDGGELRGGGVRGGISCSPAGPPHPSVARAQRAALQQGLRGLFALMGVALPLTPLSAHARRRASAEVAGRSTSRSTESSAPVDERRAGRAAVAGAALTVQRHQSPAPAATETTGWPRWPW